MKEERFLTAEQLCQRWQISKSTLQDWRSSDVGPKYLRLGTAVRYALSVIEAFEEVHTQETKPAFEEVHTQETKPGFDPNPWPLTEKETEWDGDRT